MLVEHDGRSTDVSCLLDSPESDVLLAATDQLVVVDWTELELDNVIFRHLLGNDIGFFTSMNARNVPNNDHLLAIAHSLYFIVRGRSLFANTGQEAAIRGERDTLEGCYWHSQHLEASRVVVIPHSDDGVLAFLC